MKNGHTTRQKAPAGRYALLDELRGLDLVSMMLYHACWDMMFLFGIWMDWYAGMPGRLWQQAICWVFILLSGFCAPFGRHMLRRKGRIKFCSSFFKGFDRCGAMEDGGLRKIFGFLRNFAKYLENKSVQILRKVLQKVVRLFIIRLY